MQKILTKQNLFKIITSCLLSVLLFQIIFKNFDIIVYFTNNNSDGFLWKPWVFLWLFAIIIFILITFFGKKIDTKTFIVIIILSLLGINFQKFIDLNLLKFPFKFPILTISVGYILSYENVWKVIIFAFSFAYLLDPAQIKKHLTPRTINITLNILLGLSLFMYFFIPIINHLNFNESGLDLGLYDQAIWKYSQFKYPENTIANFWGLKNILGDHFELILPLISPLYWFKSSLIILHIFNGLMIGIGAYFVYLLGKLKLKNNQILAKTVALIFLIYTGLEMAFMEGQFHPLSYVAVLIVMIIYFIEIRKWWAYWIAIIVLLFIKESMGLYVFFIGVYIFLFHRKYWKIALITSGLGVFHYLATVKAVSIIYGKPYRYFSYNSLGASNAGVLKTLITNPLYAIYVFLNPIGKIATLSLTLGSFGFLIFSSPLIIGIPMFAERFLSDSEHIWNFYMHYNAPLAGVLICALIFFIYQNYFSGKKTSINEFISKKFNVYMLVFFVLLSTVLININFRSPVMRFWWNKYRDKAIIDNNSKDISEAIKIIPKNAAVSAQNSIVTHFTERDRVYQLPVIKDTEYIVASPAKDYWLLSDKEFQEILKSSVRNGDFGIRLLKNKVLILQKGYHGELNEIPDGFFIKN